GHGEPHALPLLEPDQRPRQRAVDRDRVAATAVDSKAAASDRELDFVAAERRHIGHRDAGRARARPRRKKARQRPAGARERRRAKQLPSIELHVGAPKVASDRPQTLRGPAENEAAKSVCPVLRVRMRSTLEEKAPPRRSKQKDA